MTTLTLDDMQTHADEFSKYFADKGYESGFAQTFVRELCWVYGLDYRHSVEFERRIKKQDADGLEVSGINRIDGFFPGLLLVEMKSKGKDLTDAYAQALRYTGLLAEADRPRYLLVSDFQNLHLYDHGISKDRHAPPLCFALGNFRQHVEAMGFLCGYEKIAIARQEAANTAAANALADLHDAVKATGYGGKDLETLLVRVLFCLFGDDTGLFGAPHLFTKLVQNSRADGWDLSGMLDLLFDTLDTQTDGNKRPPKLYSILKPFPYINGNLFSGRIKPCYFDEDTRKALLACTDTDWSEISPDIFGSLFQAIMHFEDEAKKGKTKKRREYGEHYTSEANIRKAIDPLFLDDLKAELRAIRTEAKKLNAYLARLRQLKFLDPACGCGNFLVVIYREIRMLEEEALGLLSAIKGQTQRFPEVNVDQFYGIEIDPSAVQIATVALWLTDHQMNRRVKTADGQPYVRLPLTAHANILHANALRVDWNSVLPARECSFVVGNPPFVGKTYQSAAQKIDMGLVCVGMDGAGVLDYVCAWYICAASYLYGMTPAQLATLPSDTPRTPLPMGCAFVSTNSITQGEQVGVLWRWMLQQGIKINFAHRTFRWSNKGHGIAAVHCVVIGFALADKHKKVIWDYEDVNGEPKGKKAKNVNPYLVDAPNVTLERRRDLICSDAPEMLNGGKPTDGGHLLLDQQERDFMVTQDAIAAKFIRPFLMGDEFINGQPRYCLWLMDSSEHERAPSSELRKRLKAVQAMRLASTKVPTQKLAETPHLFGEIRISKTRYLAIPKVSSENRRFIPIGYLEPEVVCGDKLFFIPDATLYHFGILTSTMHNAWMRAVCGRLESRYSYSNTIVYNNFPWPTPPKVSKPNQPLALVDTAQAAIEKEAQKVLDARAAHPGKTLAWLYNPETMPPNLKAAHAALDVAVDAAYGYKGKPDDASRVAFLFKEYQKLTAKAPEKAAADKK